MARNSDGGSGNYLSNAVPALSGSNGPFTVAFWFKSPDNTQTNTYLFEGSTDGGTQWAVIFGFSAAGQIEFYDNGGSGRTNSVITIPDTNWHHVAYRKNASGASAWDKFLDGTKTSINASINFSLPTVTNEFQVFANHAGNRSKGAIQELGLWSTNLSDAQIANLANGSVDGSTLTTNQVEYWPLCGGTSPEPSSGSGAHSLTINGTVSQVSGPAGITSTCTVATLTYPQLERYGSRGIFRGIAP